MNGIENILLWGKIVVEHGGMIFDKILLLFGSLISWLMSVFEVGYDYDFINFFLNIIIFIFLGSFIAYLLSFFLGDKDFIKEYIGNNKYKSLPTIIIKGLFMIVGFIGIYFIIEITLNKMFLYTTFVREDGFIIDTKYESISTTEEKQFNKEVKVLGGFLNSFNVPYFSLDNINKNGSTTQPLIYKELNLNNTEIIFSPHKEGAGGIYSIDVNTALLLDGNNLSINSNKVYLIKNSNLFYDASNSPLLCKDIKDSVQITNISVLGTDVLSLMLKGVENKDLLSSDLVVQDFVKQINKAYLNTIDSYSYVLNKKFIGGDNLSSSEGLYQFSLAKSLCIPKSLFKGDDKKKVENIKGHLKLILNEVLRINRFSEHSINGIKKDENKFLFIFNLLKSVLINEPGSKIELIWNPGHDDRKISINQHTLSQLGIPFLIDIKMGNKIINAGMCYNYIFWPQIDSHFVNKGFGYFKNILNIGCSNNFGHIYDYYGNDIDHYGKEYYKKIIKLIEKKDSIGNDDGIQGIEGYINFGNYVPNEDSGVKGVGFQKQSIGILGNNSDDGNNYIEIFKKRLDDTTTTFKKLIESLKKLLFSIYLYLLPGIFIVIILKIIRK